MPLLQCIQPRILVFRGSRGGALLERIPGAREHHVLDCVVRRALSWISAHRLARHRARIVGADRRRSRGGVANCPPAHSTGLTKELEAMKAAVSANAGARIPTRDIPRVAAARNTPPRRETGQQRHRDLGVLIRWTDVETAVQVTGHLVREKSSSKVADCVN